MKSRTQPVTVVLSSALEIYAFKRALNDRAVQLKKSIDAQVDEHKNPRDSHVRRLWEGELKVCRKFGDVLPEITASELIAEAQMDSSARARA